MMFDTLGRLVIAAKSKQDLIRRGRHIYETIKNLKEELKTIEEQILTAAEKYRGDKQSFAMVVAEKEPLIIQIKWANAYVVDIAAAQKLKGILDEETWQGIFSEKVSISRTRQFDKNVKDLEPKVRLKVENTVSVEEKKPTIQWES